MHKEWLQLIRDAKSMQAIVKLKFKEDLNSRQIYRVIDIVIQAVKTYPASELFEGFSQFTVRGSYIIIGFYFLISPEHIGKVEKNIGHQDLSTHRLRFIYHIISEINNEHEIYDEGLPPFRVLGDISYI